MGAISRPYVAERYFWFAVRSPLAGTREKPRTKVPFRGHDHRAGRRSKCQNDIGAKNVRLRGGNR